MNPFARQFEVSSPLGPEAAAAELAASLGPRAVAFFDGSVIGADFSIARNTSGSVMFPPKITGHIASGDSGSRIEADVRTQNVLKIGMLALFSSIAIEGLALSDICQRGLGSCTVTDALEDVSALMLGWGLILYYIFRSELGKAKSFLAEIMQGQVIK